MKRKRDFKCKTKAEKKGKRRLGDLAAVECVNRRGSAGDGCASWRKSSKEERDFLIKKANKAIRVFFITSTRFETPSHRFPYPPPHRLEKRPPPHPPPQGSMRCVNRTPCSGLAAPPRGRAGRRVNRPIVASASAASSSSSPDAARSRGASAKAVASSSGRPAVDALTSSPEIVGRGNGAATSSSNPSGPLLKAVRSSR